MSSYRKMTLTPYTSFWHVNPFHDPPDPLMTLQYLVSLLEVSHAVAFTAVLF